MGPRPEIIRVKSYIFLLNLVITLFCSYEPISIIFCWTRNLINFLSLSKVNIDTYITL